MFKTLWMLPMLGTLLISPSLYQDGCDSGDDDDTPIEETPRPEMSDYERFLVYVSDLESTTDTDAREALTDEFFRDIEYSEGFPIQNGASVTFVYEQELGINEPLSVAGDFNGWDADAHPLERIVDGFWVFSTTLDFSDPGAYDRYKFVGEDNGGARIWFADPAARRFQYDSYGEYSLVAGGDQGDPSHLERYPAFYSDVMGNSRDLFLYIPPGYEHETRTYPVLYMHDGQNLFDPESNYGGWQVDDVIDQLLAQGDMDEILVVGVANTPDRMDEYTHVEDFLVGYGLVGGEAPLYADFLVNEVKPFVDERYRSRLDREETAVLGSSLGGLVSYYIGWAYPDVFGLVGGMSSTLGWGSIGLENPTMIEIIGESEPLMDRYYLDSGGDDGGGCVDADGDGIEDDNPNADDNYCETLQMERTLEELGYGSDDLLYIWAPGAEHNEAAWHARMHYPLTFWFGTDG